MIKFGGAVKSGGGCYMMPGFFNYHAVPTNSVALSAFRYHVTVLWLRALRRRSQKDRMTWARMAKLAKDWLPKPRILHPWPSQRFASNTQGRSRVRGSCSHGSVRGDRGNPVPYRECSGYPYTGDDLWNRTAFDLELRL